MSRSQSLESGRCASSGGRFPRVSTWLQVRTRPFLLQTTAQGNGPELDLTFQTLGGNVAASFKWNSASTPQDLPEAVLREIRSSGFECPFEPLLVSNLRLIKPDGTLLDMSPDALSVAEQLACLPGPRLGAETRECRVL